MTATAADQPTLNPPAPVDPPIDAPASVPPTDGRVSRSPGDAPTPIWLPFALWLAFLAITLIANNGALRGAGEFLWTDRALIADNSMLNSLGGLQRLWAGIFSPSTYDLPQYAPLAQTSFFIDRLIWGDNVVGYRLTSCLLHATTGLMLWYLLHRLAVPAAIVASLLFVAHPMTVEAVSLLSERRVVLATLFGLAGLFLILRAAGAIRPVDGARFDALPTEPSRLYTLGGTLWALALFAQPAIAMVAPIALLIVWWKRARIDITLVSVAIGTLVAGTALFVTSASIERANSDAPAQAWRLTASAAGDLATRAQIAGRAVGFYVQKLVVPYPLMNDYPRWTTPADVALGQTFAVNAEDAERFARLTPAVGPGQQSAWIWPVAVVIVAVGGIVVAHRRAMRGAIVCIAGFLLLLLPFLGFVAIGWSWNTFVADHHAYAASAIFIAGLVAALAPVLSNPAQRASIVATIAIIAVTYTLLGARVSRRYDDALTFWRENANVTYGNPNSPLALIGFSDAVLQETPPDLERSGLALNRALRLRPADPGLLVRLGDRMRLAGGEEQAHAIYGAAIARFPSDGRPFAAAGDLFNSQATTRPTDPTLRLNELTAYTEAVARDPRDANAYIRIGETAFEIIRRLPDNDPQITTLRERAAQAFDAAIQIEPYNVDYLARMAYVLLQLGFYQDTSRLLGTARTLAPERADLYELIGEASLLAQDFVGAESAVREAVRLDPTRFSAVLKLGSFLQAQERFGEAKTFLEQAVELQPDHAEAKRRLAEVTAAAATRPSPTSQSVPASAFGR